MKQRIQNKHDDALKKYLKMFDSTTDKKMVIEEVFDNLDCIPKDIALWKTFIEFVIPEKERKKASKELLDAFKQDCRFICSFNTTGNNSNYLYYGEYDPFNRLQQSMFADEEFTSKTKIIGHTDSLKRMVLNGADVNQSWHNYSILNVVCGCDLSEDLAIMVEILLKAGANPNNDSHHRCPMMDLFTHNKNTKEKEALKALIKAGAEINWCDNQGNTPIFKLLYYDDRPEMIELVNLLINKGVDLHHINNAKANVWHYLFYNNFTETAYELTKVFIDNGIACHLNEVGRIPVFEAVIYLMPLVEASMNQSHCINDLITLLLENGADPNSIYRQYGMNGHAKDTALFYLACCRTTFQSSLEAMETLLKAGCNPNIYYDTDFYSPLWQAIRSDNRLSLDKVKLLLKYGAVIKDGYPIDIAARIDSERGREIFKLLLDKYPLKNHEDWWQMIFSNIIRKYKGNDKYQKLENLLEIGFDINAEATNKNINIWPIINEVSSLSSQDLEWLIEHGADVNSYDKNGLTPLMRLVNYYKSDENFEEKKNILLKSGANPKKPKRIVSLEKDSETGEYKKHYKYQEVDLKL